MDEYNYKFGIVINGEIHDIKISESPSSVYTIDPPYVGHLQLSHKVNFNNYSDGQLIFVATKWRNIDTETVGEIPADLMSKIYKNKDYNDNL